MSQKTLFKIMAIAGFCSVVILAGALLYIVLQGDNSEAQEETPALTDESNELQQRENKEPVKNRDEVGNNAPLVEKQVDENQVVQLKLFFADSSLLASGKTGTYGFVQPVIRVLPFNPGVLRLALEELVKGPEPGYDDFTAIMPDTVQILNLELRADGVAVINLSSDALKGPGGSLGSLIFMQAVVLTATQFATVESVQVLIEGHPYEDGHVIWNMPLGPEDVIYLENH